MLKYIPNLWHERCPNLARTRRSSIVRQCVQNILDRESRIDLLFAAAGVQLFANIEDTSIEEINKMLRKAQPIQRLGTSEETGKAVMFLWSDECPFMTGALVSVDGGDTCQ